MKQKYNKYIAILLALVAIVACSDEDALEPSHADRNGFAPLDTDVSVTANIRRNFFNATGAYLLFTDTLTTYRTDGQPELLQPYYGITGTKASMQSSYTYAYITAADRQQQCADLVQRHIAARLGKAVPNAFMIVDEISYLNSYGNKRTATNLLGTRAYVLSMGNGQAQDDPETWFGDMFLGIVTDLLDRVDEAQMDAFYDISDKYYGEYLEDYGWTEGLSQQETWDLGFFSYTESSWWGDYFPYKSNDLKAWIEAVLEYNPTEFEATYGSSATMMNKYNKLRNIIISLGITLDE